jgi:hypothetical protein
VAGCAAGGIPLLYPGSKVPPEEQGQVIIDWDAAVAEATHQPANQPAT